MYESGTVAAISLGILGSGLWLQSPFMVPLGIAGLVFALYLYAAIEKNVFDKPTIISQLALFLVGATTLFACYGGFRELLVESARDEPNLVVVIGGFIVLPMIAVMGFAMACCSLFSKRLSHQWLVYLAEGRKRSNEPLF